MDQTLVICFINYPKPNYRVEAECKLTGSLAPYSIRHQPIGSPHAAPYMSIATNSGVPLLHMLPLPMLLENQFSLRNYILHKSWSGISHLLRCITYIIIHFFQFDSTVSPYCFNVIAHLFLYFVADIQPFLFVQIWCFSSIDRIGTITSLI